MIVSSLTYSSIDLQSTVQETQSLQTANPLDGLPLYKLQRVIDYMHQHLHQEIQLADLAKVAKMSQFYFCHLFKQSMGTSPYQFLIQQRVERAKQLLQDEEMTISEIALECGFSNQSHFTRRFRQLTGITPKVYRNQQKMLAYGCKDSASVV
ncbi:helix-turn-helix transcriptional regulator [Oscillatoria sp. FACHB-1407]|uniref:helix-turn-helix domain-containing protein n=1 Tax=Oscillatoria sp. FACHB-1407 TaxID=2692847 RepID=UPI00168335BA|nr:AraC family transcriptional regulator [Oscillatoria sp. FACHB-1407]MBD2465228.1 helix-turn-helix transcriptional regulator [Oscillatoria sp. FACHB-1407]